MLDRLSKIDVRRDIERDFERGRDGWQNLVAAAGWDGIAIASAPHHRGLEGRRISEAAHEAARRMIEWTSISRARSSTAARR